MNKPISPQQALARLEALCARSEQASGEVLEKMRRWGVTQADAEKVLDSLVAGRYVDDSRFAAAFVRDKVRFARWGKRKIAQALAQKKIGRDIITAALDAVDQDEYTDSLRHILQAKIKSNPALTESYEGRTKIYRFGMQRGFEPELTGRLLREILSAIRKK